MNTPLRIFGTAIVAVSGLLMTVATAPLAHATTTTIVSLTFDDGPSDDTQLPSLLSGLPATLFINSGRVGSNGYLSWDQITQLNQAGYEIGGHTVTHADLPTLSTDEQKRQVCDDRSALLNHGFNVISFAYPYGDNTPDTETIVKDCGYNGARTVGSLWSNTSCSACAATNTVPPADAYDVATPDSIKSGTTVADLQNLVTHAETGGGWLPLVFHHLCSGSNCPVYSVDPTVLSDFASWLKTQSNVQVETFGTVIGGAVQPAVAGPPAPAAAPGQNMLQNASLETASNGTVPDCWQQGHLSTGTSATFSRSTSAHTGSYAERIDVSSISSGDAKLVSTQDLGQCAPSVTPGHYYAISAWYESDVQPVIVVFYRDSSGHWSYYTQSKPALAASSTWQDAALTVQAPAGATALSVGMAITAVGFVAMDDFSVIEDQPTATLTSPADGSTVKGVTSVSASASAPSPDAVSKVELLVNGAVVDATTSTPYTFAWNTTTQSDGTASLAVRATDTQGNAATSPSILVTIANNPPGGTAADTQAPSLTFFAPPLATLASKVRLAWFGSDSGSGVASYDVRYRKAPYTKGFGAWTYPSGWQHATVGSVQLVVAAGYDYCAQVRARDKAGNLTPWSTARCVTRALDDRALAASKGWTRGKAKGFYLGTFTSTRARNASLTRSGAQVDRIGVVATRCSTCGTIAIYVGSKLIKKVSLTASKTRRAQLILLPRFAYRKGTITIRVLTTKKTVQIDGLVACRT